MLSDTMGGETEKKMFPLKQEKKMFISHERAYVLACLSALGNGKKLKPFSVFE